MVGRGRFNFRRKPSEEIRHRLDDLYYIHPLLT